MKKLTLNKKINLKQLHQEGKINFNLDLGSYVTFYSSSANLFDGSFEYGSEDRIHISNGSPLERFTLTFSPSIELPNNKVYIKTYGAFTADFNIEVNGDSNTSQSINIPFEDSYTNMYESNLIEFDTGGSTLSSIQYDLLNAWTPSGNKSTTSTSHHIYEIEIWTDKDVEPYEFNDSVLETQAWNSSRYTGKQLQASVINEYNNGDSSYKNTPAVSNYTRTFYLTSDIISLSPNSNNEFEDSTLPYIEDFSFVVVNQAITINEDDSITLIDLSTINSNQPSKITGFQRYFQNNIPIKSEIGLIPLDAAVPNNTDNSYTVYFNEGRLRKIADFTHAIHTTVGDDALGFGYNPNSDPPSFTPLSGSAPVTDPINGRAILIDTKYARQILGPGFTGDDFNKNYSNGGVAWTALFNSMVTESLVNPSTSKYFISFSTSASFSSSYYPTEKALKVINYESDQYGTTNTLAGLSTILLAGQAGKGLYSDYSVNTNKNYFSPIRYAQYSDGAGGDNLPDDQTVTGYSISKLDNSKPCLLINLSKNELPGGSGNKSTVIIPETLHPYVKDNLIFFLSKAGIDIGSREAIPALDKTNVNLP